MVLLMTTNNGSTNWPKPGARIRPDLYRRIKRAVEAGQGSFNTVLNKLIEEALDNRKDVRA